MEFVLLILGIIIDRVTKLWAVKTLTTIPEIVVIKGFFSFSYLENRGAAFGIFQNKILFLTIITISVMVGMIYYVVKYKPTSKLLRMSLALIISGAVGNLIDRMVYNYVVDFILVHYKDVYYFPTFNIADMLVVGGTILLGIYIIKEESYGE